MSTENENVPVAGVRRMVTYWAYGTPGGEYPALADRAAIITCVYPEPPDLADPEVLHVGLCVLSPTGVFFNQLVPYTPYDEPKGGHWSWPKR